MASCHCLEKLSLASWSNTGIQDLAALIVQNAATLKVMALRVVKFFSGGYKLERFLPKNQNTQRKLLNFEFWINGELSKIGHYFSK